MVCFRILPVHGSTLDARSLTRVGTSTYPTNKGIRAYLHLRGIENIVRHTQLILGSGINLAPKRVKWFQRVAAPGLLLLRFMTLDHDL